LREWSSERHLSLIRAVPGLSRFVQNHVVPDPDQGKPFCDAVGELWFESADAVPEALQSQEFAAVVEDRQSFVDSERTGMVVVNEKELSATSRRAAHSSEVYSPNVQPLRWGAGARRR
jgi:uncharacterized protein (TIGR02118 family)